MTKKRTYLTRKYMETCGISPQIIWNIFCSIDKTDKNRFKIPQTPEALATFLTQAKLWNRAGHLFYKLKIPLDFQGFDFQSLPNPRVLIRADLQYADLRNAILSELNLSHSKLHNASLQSATCYQTNFTYATATGADFSHALLTEANLENLQAIGANFKEASLRSANLHGTALQRSNLQGANFAQTILKYTAFQGAYMQNIKYFHTANIKQISLKGTGILFILGYQHHIIATPDTLTIGCKTKTHENWKEISQKPNEDIHHRFGEIIAAPYVEHKALLLAAMEVCSTQGWPTFEPNDKLLPFSEE